MFQTWLASNCFTWYEKNILLRFWHYALIFILHANWSNFQENKGKLNIIRFHLHLNDIHHKYFITTNYNHQNLVFLNLDRICLYNFLKIVCAFISYFLFNHRVIRMYIYHKTEYIAWNISICLYSWITSNNGWNILCL